VFGCELGSDLRDDFGRGFRRRSWRIWGLEVDLSTLECSVYLE
jgi:hypothetical protein